MQCRKEIGAFASPDVIHWAPALPKTRSGKIMRRILRKIAAGEVSEEDARTHAHIQSCTRAHLHAHACTRARMHACTHARMRTCTHTAAGQVSEEDLGDTSTLAEPAVVDTLVGSRPM